jgi:hypothetical protein|tara:strand:- start:509 stop:1045 length:537 start_codon:yes stop_codon:yes gene_type:complete
MRPRADEILRSIAWTFDRYISPDLHDPFAQSLGLSIGYLLRSVEQRIQHEGPALWECNRAIRMPLELVRELIAGSARARAESVFTDLLGEIDAALGKEYRDPDDYPTLESLTDEAVGLRWPLTHAIEALQQHPEAFDEIQYTRTRAEIRDYLKLQLEREAAYVQIRSIEGLDPLGGRV